MSRELFSHDPMTGLSVWMDYNELTDEVVLQYDSDVEPLLEENKILANDNDYTKQGIKQSMWKYADIPSTIMMKWLIEDGLDVLDDNAWPQVLKKLNDPEYRHLKTTSKFHK